MADVFTVGTTAVSIAASPNSNAVVSNGGSGTLYYKTTSDVSSTSNDGSIAPRASVTFTSGVHWLIASAAGVRTSVSYVPDQNTDMATQAELNSVTAGVTAGTLAARPSASTASSQLYFASDDTGGTLYRSDGSSWTKVSAAVNDAAGGRELGYAEITTSATTTNTSALDDVAGLATTVTVGSRPIVVMAWAGSLSHSAASGQVYWQLQEGATALALCWVTASAAGEKTFGWARRRLAPSAGSHTYKVTMGIATAGTGTATASATSPAHIQVMEC